ncbi:MAG: ABC transporter ATP-binding protein [Chloroflexi bacterium]|nr:ABC transporter ATP-binding protein [Chloroflexota bacterium]
MTAVVCAERVGYCYPQNNHGLEPISLNFQPGGLVLVTGPSGCGKSTLARCLTGLIPHLYRGRLSGEVWLDGLRTQDVPLWQLTRQAGLVFQNPAAQMLALTVEEEIIFGLENLGLPRDVIRERLEDVLVRFGLELLRTRSPQTLSGGEQQKLALAAITARRSPVLVLDEPLSMLDATAAVDLVAHLADLSCNGTTVVICEHRAEYLRPIPDLQTIILNGTVSTRQASHIPRIAHHVSRFTLQVSNLGVKLDGKPVLQNLSFSTEGAQVLAVVGRNGVGKTTLLRALAGLQKHTGTVTVNGDRPDLGMVFQNPDLQLFNATVRDEILYRLPEPNMSRYAWLLAVLGLSRYEETPPLLLSEGEKKRVALATVLMRDPRHGVLLDEPALGQDDAHKERLIALARALADTGQLVILTTHDLTLAAQADRLLLLGRDGLVADGPPDEILRDNAAWAQIGLRVPEWVV